MTQVDPDRLPPDAEFKGYEDVVVQDVLFRTDNVLVHKEKFYSPSQHQTYLRDATGVKRETYSRYIRASTELKHHHPRMPWRGIFSKRCGAARRCPRMHPS
jgi:hypothetical protein